MASMPFTCKENICKVFYVDRKSLGTTLVLGLLDTYKEECRAWDVMNVFRFVSLNEPLELWLHSGKERNGTQRKLSADGPAAADEIQTKNKNYDTQQKCLFLPQ